MQTFLPYDDFKQTVKCLDYRRLGKQRVETYQILRTLAGISKGWQNHPAVKMWRGYEGSLVEYGIECCKEWIKRGYKDTTLAKIQEFKKMFPNKTKPPWFSQQKFHDSHKSKLMQKLPDHYKQFGWAVPIIDYFWPV